MVLPGITFVFGEMFYYLEHFIIILYGASMLIALVSTVARLQRIFYREGFSAKLLVGLSNSLYSAIIPWRQADEDLREIANNQREEIERLENLLMNMSLRLDAFMLNQGRVHAQQVQSAAPPLPLGNNQPFIYPDV